MPLGKSLSVDENALSGQQHLVHPSAGFGRPSSMLARASSSSGAVLNTANANAQQSAHGVSSTNGLAQRMKASSLSQGGAPAGKMADNNKAGGASAGPRRALGDISNATKVGIYSVLLDEIASPDRSTVLIATPPVRFNAVRAQCRWLRSAEAKMQSVL